MIGVARQTLASCDYLFHRPCRSSRRAEPVRVTSVAGSAEHVYNGKLVLLISISGGYYDFILHLLN